MRRQLYLMGWKACGLTHLSPVAIHCGAPYGGPLVASGYSNATVNRWIAAKIGYRGSRESQVYATSAPTATGGCKLS